MFVMIPAHYGELSSRYVPAFSRQKLLEKVMKRNRCQKTCQNDIDRGENVNPLKGDYYADFVL